MHSIELFLAILIGVPALIGAYSMALGIMTLIASKNRWMFLGFIFPGLAYLVGYSLLGSLWVFQFWKYFTKDGPVHSIVDIWKDNQNTAFIATVQFVATWGIIVWWLYKL